MDLEIRNSVFNNFRTLYNNQFCTRFGSKNLNTFEYSFNLHSNIYLNTRLLIEFNLDLKIYSINQFEYPDSCLYYIHYIFYTSSIASSNVFFFFFFFFQRFSIVHTTSIQSYHLFSNKRKRSNRVGRRSYFLFFVKPLCENKT